MRNFVLLFLCALCFSILPSCSDFGPKTWYYYWDDNPSDSYVINAIYFVPSPEGANGNWGENKKSSFAYDSNLNMYTLSGTPGTYDLRVDYVGNTGAQGSTEFNTNRADDWYIKFNISATGNFYTSRYPLP